MVEAVTCIFIYSFGVAILFYFRGLLKIERNAYKRLFIEYVLLLLCCFARLIFNALLYFTDLNQDQRTDNCADIDPNNNTFRYLYLTMGYTLMHALPIFTLVAIYWPREHKKSVSDLLFEEIETSEYTVI